MSGYGNTTEAPRPPRDADYAYAVARVRSNEPRLLTRQDLEALLAAGDCERCMALLGDRGWGDGSGKLSEDAVLAAEERKLWAFIDELAPGDSAFDYLRVVNDMHNLKAALKGRLSQSEWKQMYMTPANVPAETIERAVTEKDFELLPEHMREPAVRAYEALVTWVDGQLCEIILDRASLEISIMAAKQRGGLPLALAELDAFAADIRIAVRCAAMKKPLSSIKRAVASGTRLDTARLAEAAAQGVDEIRGYLADIDSEAAAALGEGLAAFETLCARRREALLDAHKYDILGPAPLVVYAIRRQTELRDARVILAGKRNGVPDERIRALLQI